MPHFSMKTEQGNEKIHKLFQY